ncbi:MAG: hypothetical protein EXR37_01960 [Limnohabitans sp.]|nr:hypothetical protein [Limnohabitans sp.]
MAPLADTAICAGGCAKRWLTIGLFTHEGARHIWNGTDHLLFLLTLLLPGLMLTVQPAQTTGSSKAFTDSAALRFALKVITAFTIAHSITLAFSVFGWVSLPEKLIESMIDFVHHGISLIELAGPVPLQPLEARFSVSA